MLKCKNANSLPETYRNVTEKSIAKRMRVRVDDTFHFAGLEQMQITVRQIEMVLC